MATKSNWWDKLLKIVIAVASAVLGALGVQAMYAYAGSNRGAYAYAGSNRGA